MGTCISFTLPDNLPTRKKVFDSWVKFALPWILLSSLVAFLMPVDGYTQSFMLGGVRFPPFYLAIVFFSLSILVIIFRSIQIYRHKK